MLMIDVCKIQIFVGKCLAAQTRMWEHNIYAPRLISGKLLFEDGQPLTFGDFMKGILTLRGSNQTTVKDARLHH